MPTVIDEYSRKCLAIRVGSALKADDVLYTLSDLFVTEGVPNYIRSDNGNEAYSPNLAGMGQEPWRKDSVYRAGVAVGEWI